MVEPNNMILRIYLILLGLFAIGAIAFFFINRKRESRLARNNWIKYITYFFIIHTLFISIVFFPRMFRWLAVIIIFAGLFEMIRLINHSGTSLKGFFTFSLILYALLGLGFYHFSGMESRLVLFVFLVLSIFDAFSQLTGQLTGKTKILPVISPNKTLEGFIGGLVFAMSGSLVFRGLTGLPLQKVLILSAIIVLAAFLGDVSSSFYKRKSKVKDFSTLIPGHGGFLDRFDSFIVAGAFLSLLQLVVTSF
jgi:phosphatidate cytidylyltransferase